MRGKIWKSKFEGQIFFVWLFTLNIRGSNTNQYHSSKKYKLSAVSVDQLLGAGHTQKLVQVSKNQFLPAFACAQHPKAGQNTQQARYRAEANHVSKDSTSLEQINYLKCLSNRSKLAFNILIDLKKMMMLHTHCEKKKFLGLLCTFQMVMPTDKQWKKLLKLCSKEPPKMYFSSVQHNFIVLSHTLWYI